MTSETPDTSGHLITPPLYLGRDGPILALSDHKRHLVCLPYDVLDLHRLAEILGIGEHFFHRKPYPHYDIPARRVAEIQARTLVVRPRDIVMVCRSGYDRP